MPASDSNSFAAAEKTASTALTTKKIGPYIILRKLGEGGFSKVKMGVHEITGKEVAIKIIDNNAMDKDKMKREIALSRLLDHDNVVRLHDVFELNEKNATCLVMDYMPGGDLCDYLSQHGAMPESKVIRLMIQLIDGVQYCHERKVIHRDLKPDNILLGDDMNVKISDFGLSGMLKPGAFLQSFCGSAPYCSPEILRRQKYIGPEVDMWALGVVLYTLLTARFPWPGRTWDQQILSAIRGKWMPSSQISPLCADLLNRMLHPDSHLRATLPEVRNHPWIMQGMEQSAIDSPSTFPQIRSESQLNAGVLGEVAAVGFSATDVKRDILANAVASPGAVLYHLFAGQPETSADKTTVITPPSTPPSSRSLTPPPSPVMRAGELSPQESRDEQQLAEQEVGASQLARLAQATFPLPSSAPPSKKAKSLFDSLRRKLARRRGKNSGDGEQSA